MVDNQAVEDSQLVYWGIVWGIPEEGNHFVLEDNQELGYQELGYQ